MYSHQNNFAKALKWTGDLRDQYLNTLAALRIYERFRKLTAPNVVGKKNADANVKIFGKYPYFFSPAQEAARCYFFVELAKFFDKNKKKQSLTIELLLDFVENNFSSFSKNEFLAHHIEKNFIPALLEGYKPFTLQDIRRIRNRLLRNKELISDLKTYRDQYLVHNDLKKDDVKITGIQIRTLFKIIQSTIDLFYLKLNFSSTIYSNYDKEPARAVDEVVSALQEHEKEIIRKIKEKYGS